MLGLIYVCVSSSTSAHLFLYFIFFVLDISFSNKYTLFLHKCHKNSYEASEQMSKLGFFPSQSHTGRDDDSVLFNSSLLSSYISL